MAGWTRMGRPGRVVTSIFLVGMHMSEFCQEGRRNRDDREGRYYEGLVS